ncbi:MAG: hypothetical protein ACK55Z_35955 [bacterium]
MLRPIPQPAPLRARSPPGITGMILARGPQLNSIRPHMSGFVTDSEQNAQPLRRYQWYLWTPGFI